LYVFTKLLKCDILFHKIEVGILRKEI